MYRTSNQFLNIFGIRVVLRSVSLHRPLNDVVLFLDEQRMAAQLSLEELFDALVNFLQAALAEAQPSGPMQQVDDADEIAERLLLAHAPCDR